MSSGIIIDIVDSPVDDDDDDDDVIYKPFSD